MWVAMNDGIAGTGDEAAKTLKKPGCYKNRSTSRSIHGFKLQFGWQFQPHHLVLVLEADRVLAGR